MEIRSLFLRKPRVSEILCKHYLLSMQINYYLVRISMKLYMCQFWTFGDPPMGITPSHPNYPRPTQSSSMWQVV